MKIKDNFPKNIPQGIKTRYDDIMQDILREKSEKYAKSIESPEPTEFHTIGELIGKKLDIKI